ncbi:phospholipase B1, membrane-associated-like [Paramuricea clavata]|uniref:Phospholipase B1, membrane-associated n=1 Tax=Paramuricea clavata TaxID=317549 RepID=A0A7D9DVB6_PARCT|nr:phospholipase B1, membrane-associated-like [Paramuricea clavata]
MMKDLPAPVTLEHVMSSTFIKKHFMDSNLNNTSYHPIIEKPDFHCEVKNSGLQANSVHQVTAADISVVASLGDSIMIGLGARGTTMVDFFTEYRGISWSNGGDADLQDILTLPNILKKFNPKLKGYSTNIARHYEKNSGLNFATVSATSRHLEEQVHQLITKVKQDKTIDFKEDWKLVNIMSGTRDLCRLCGDMDEVTPDDYIRSLVKTLDTLQTKMPRTFVNLILPINVSSLYALNNRGRCMMGNWSICPCLGNEFMRKKISNFYEGYKSLVYELIGSGVYDRDEDFTVVLQPVFEDLLFDVPKDRDLFSLDCLHFSAKGNALAATALWNNMFEPVHKKLSRWHKPLTIKCPIENSPYLSTRTNSKTEAKSKRDQDSKSGMSPAVIVTVTLAIIFALSLITAFVYLKHRLRTPITKLKFSNKPWLKYSI